MSEWFDNDYFRVLVPSGWKLFLGIDSNGMETQKKVHIYKDADLIADIYTHVGVTVCFFGKQDRYLSTKYFYDNTADIEAFSLGTYTWNGYTCTSLGYPYTMLEAKHGECVFAVMILMENRGYRISLEDENVRMILESLMQNDQ